MKKAVLIYSFIQSVFIFAQYQVGHTTITFNDPARSGGFGSGGGPGGQIQTEIYYPALVNGEDVAVAPLAHPLIVFGHGFAMSWEAYENIWEHYVALGYIVAFPRTEGGIFPAPVHYDFALDLVIVESKIQALNYQFGSLFYTKISPNSAIMGHSMGGGATILTGNEMSATVKTVIGFAPAETSPSAIDSAVNIIVPALIFSGSADGVTPPIDHHIPIYNALASDCKTFVSIVGGAHCYFANSNFNCDFGESSSSTGIILTRTQQQNITYSLLTPWLDFYLKENCDAFLAFEDSIYSVEGTAVQRICNYTSLDVSADLTHINVGGDGAIDVTITGGEEPIIFDWSNGSPTLDQINLNEGIYALSVSDSFCTVVNEYQILGPAEINEQAFAKVQFYPNPSQDVVSVAFEGRVEETISITITDVSGKLIQQIEHPCIIGENIIQINLENLAPGIYFFRMNEEYSATVVLQ